MATVLTASIRPVKRGKNADAADETRIRAETLKIYRPGVSTRMT
jgi:hypothetical protein